MSTTYPNLARFIRALHRRLFWVRLFERIGVCLLSVSAVALLMVSLLMIRGQSGLAFSATLMTGAVLAGAVWGISRRPTSLDAAMLADQQLHLHDLLGTATLLNRTPATDVWQKTVLAMADAQCQQLSPVDVLSRRWGGRAWGSTGLLVALVLTLALLSVNPTPTAARQTATDVRPNPIAKTIQRPSERDRDLGPAAHTNPRPFRPGSDDDDDKAPKPDGSISPEDAHGNGDSPEKTPAQPSGISGAVDSRGTGSATGRPPSPPPQLIPSAVGNATAPSKNTGTRAAGGTAGEAHSPTSDNPSKGGFTAGSSKHEVVPPWQAPTWSHDIQRASQETNDRHLPDTYRPLIQEYFQQ